MKYRGVNKPKTKVGNMAKITESGFKYKIINPNKNETYEIAYDDHCLVVKVGNSHVYISKSMANWIAFNFADKTNIDIKLVK